jgi:hypothetical protein
MVALHFGKLIMLTTKWTNPFLFLIFLAFHLFYFLSHSQENAKNHGFIEKKEERRAIQALLSVIRISGPLFFK